MDQYTVADLLYLMQRLRDPDTGCPWDVEQTFATILPHTLEEAYEVADAIERQDFPHLEEELGDLLFQVIFYAQMGREQGHFNFAKIVDTLVRKLLRRHPHVFPEGTLESQRDPEKELTHSEIKRNWKRIKEQERAAKPEPVKTALLDQVPVTLPALQRAQKLQAEAAQVGFDWPQVKPVLAKLKEEITELEEALENTNQDHIRAEIGDLLFSCVNLARHVGVNSDTALRETNSKFERRFGYVEKKVGGAEKMKKASLDELDQYWDEAKEKDL